MAARQEWNNGNKIYLYKIPEPINESTYDETVAAVCLQGIINRKFPRVYIISKKDRSEARIYGVSKNIERPESWLKLMSEKGRWLHGKTIEVLSNLNDLMKIAKDYLNGVVIWDPEVQASINIATTIAGVENGVVLSYELAKKYLSEWKLDVIKDLREFFDGSESGSSKNDAYRWAIKEYLAKGLCSSHLICLYDDSFLTRHSGDVRYVVTRDWAIKNRAFVFDLSPWGDEKPLDDPQQPNGTDLETYKLILEQTLKQSDGRHMTELAGFFSSQKYSNVSGHKSIHHPVATEWETVYLISPYNCYQNTVAHNCYNQSFHSHAPFTPLKQRRPQIELALKNKTYICFHMADYDSTTPLYNFLLDIWNDQNKGKIPLAWGINPNLIETYPDIVTYFYETATKNDYFVSDASAAGYFNPNRIKKQYLPLMIKHNKHFFKQTDMSIAPMVLDWDNPTDAVKDAFTEFSPDGFAIIVTDFHGTGGKPPNPHVWKGMSVLEMLNSACNSESANEAADILLKSIKNKSSSVPQFHYIRIIWKNPTYILEIVDLLQKARPHLDILPVDPYTFFRLFKEYGKMAWKNY